MWEKGGAYGCGHKVPICHWYRQRLVWALLLPLHLARTQAWGRYDMIRYLRGGLVWSRHRRWMKSQLWHFWRTNCKLSVRLSTGQEAGHAPKLETHFPNDGHNGGMWPKGQHRRSCPGDGESLPVVDKATVHEIPFSDKQKFFSMKKLKMCFDLFSSM